MPQGSGSRSLTATSPTNTFRTAQRKPPADVLSAKKARIDQVKRHTVDVLKPLKGTSPDSPSKFLSTEAKRAPTPAKGIGEDVGSVALSVYNGNTAIVASNTSSFTFENGYYNLAPYGSNPYFFHYTSVPYWSWGYQPWGWCSPLRSLHRPWYTCATPWWGGSHLNLSFFSRRWRFRFGFGFSYSPYCGYNSYSSWYPCHRRYVYYPYSYYTTCSYYPAYSTVYHSSSVVDYVETYDPYVTYSDTVDYVDSVSAEAVAVPVAELPAEFRSAFVVDFPGTVPTSGLMAYGNDAMRRGAFMMAAEAFRRAWVAAPADSFAALRVGEALFGAGERYDLGGLAVETAMDLNPKEIQSSRDIRLEFPGSESFDLSLRNLQRHTLMDPKDGDARFLLGYILLVSGDAYGSFTQFQSLEDGGWTSPHLDSFMNEAQRRLTGR